MTLPRFQNYFGLSTSGKTRNTDSLFVDHDNDTYSFKNINLNCYEEIGHKNELKIGDFAVAKFATKKSVVAFMGRVKQIDGYD